MVERAQYPFRIGFERDLRDKVTEFKKSGSHAAARALERALNSPIVAITYTIMPTTEPGIPEIIRVRTGDPEAGRLSKDQRLQNTAVKTHPRLEGLTERGKSDNINASMTTEGEGAKHTDKYFIPNSDLFEHPEAEALDRSITNGVAIGKDLRELNKALQEDSSGEVSNKDAGEAEIASEREAIDPLGGVIGGTPQTEEPRHEEQVIPVPPLTSSTELRGGLVTFEGTGGELQDGDRTTSVNGEAPTVLRKPSTVPAGSSAGEKGQPPYVSEAVKFGPPPRRIGPPSNSTFYKPDLTVQEGGVLGESAFPSHGQDTSLSEYAGEPPSIKAGSHSTEDDTFPSRGSARDGRKSL